MKEKVDLSKVKMPKHLAIILDGNGTWAKARNLPRTAGHKAGADNLLKISKYCNKIGIEYLTLFAFSTENWNRPADEVSFLMNLLEFFFKNQKRTVIRDNVQMKVIGTRRGLSDKLVKIIDDIEEVGRRQTGIHINIAFNYGSYEEMEKAVKEIAQEAKDGKIDINDITSDMISDHLYTKGQPPVDLLIRTSGQERISNFLLWQIAYSEIIFTKTLWPDFTTHDLDMCLVEYTNRDRRFGAIK